MVVGGSRRVIDLVISNAGDLHKNSATEVEPSCCLVTTLGVLRRRAEIPGANRKGY